jgi:hypothetical protein
VAVAIGAIALIGVIALLAHRSAPAPAAPPSHRRGLTFITQGGIGDYVPPGRKVISIHLLVRVRDANVRAFGWSADGERIAYMASNGAPSAICTLRVHDFASGHTKLLAAWVSHDGSTDMDCGAIGDEVAWSPNGRYIAYTAAGRLHTIDTRTGVSHQLGAASLGITWWPDGRIAYICPRNTGGPIRWCAVRPDGSNRTSLPFHGSDMVWSPTAGRVAYLAFGHGRLPSLHVWTALPNGRDAHLLYAQPHGGCCAGATPDLAWSPDGTRLVFTDAVYNAHIVNATTGNQHAVSWWSYIGVTPEHGRPAWRP